MKNKIFFLFGCFIMLATIAVADNLNVNTITMLAGTEKQIPIELNNPNGNYVSCQFDIVMPEGFSIPQNGIVKNNDRISSHQLTYVLSSENTYRVMIYSMPVKDFSGKSGTIATVTIQCDENVPIGDYTISIISQKFTDDSGKKQTFNDTKFSIGVNGIEVKVNSYRRIYGDENPVFEYSADEVINGIPEIACEATEGSPVGTYPIKILKGTITNKNVIFVDGELVVEKAPLTVIADNKQVVQGENMPVFTATYEGFKNDDTTSSLIKQPQITCDASGTSEPGRYAISVSGAEADNYTFQYVNGTLTVVEAQAVVVTVRNCNRKYGDTNPEYFEYDVEGGTLNGSPLISCEATKESPVGMYEISVDRGSITNYNVTFVNGTLTVEKALLTIKADDKEMLIGNPVPSFTATYHGFKNNELPSVLTKLPSFSCTASSSSAGGEYTITVHGAEALNYDFSYEKGLLTITDPPLVVNVMNCEREYGENNPEWNYTVEGGNLIGKPLLHTEATRESPVGAYDIIIERGEVLNSNVTYINGKMTIRKAPLEIKAKDFAIMQGETMPQFSATYHGFKLSDNEKSLSKQPIFSCEVDKSFRTGEYAIAVAGAEATNYEITFTNGVLSIIEPQVTVIVNDKVRQYGDKNPSFDYFVYGGQLYGEPVITCKATETSAVGVYDIIIERGTVSNNKITFLNGKMQVEKAPLTITAEDKQMKAGESLPELTAIYQGFKNGETALNLERAPEILCTATSESEPGEYPIVASSAESINYDIRYVNGVLHIDFPDPVIAEISNPTAGELRNNIEKAGFSAHKVNQLKVTGLLNGSDIKGLREMTIEGNLSDLDIENASIVSGGEPYYGEGIMEKRTEDNTIGQFMFSNCTQLVSIKLPKTALLIKYAFANCPNLLRLDIPESCVVVGRDAISSCPSLTTITIPAATQSFDNYNCTFCPNLKNIEVSPDNLWLRSVDGVLYSRDMTTLIKYPMGKNETSFLVPQTVAIIDGYAFYSSLLNSIKLPEGLLSIGNSAFSNTDNLTEIVIPQSVSSIGMSAFSQCKNLKSLILPRGLTTIESHLASFCENLDSISIPCSVTSIEGFAFAHCKSLSKISCHITDISSVEFGKDYSTGIANSFVEISPNCVWHVVKDTSDKYKQPWWVDSWTIFDDLPNPCNINETNLDISNDNIWHTLSGSRLDHQPTQRGIYLHGGKKVMVK